MNASKLRVVIVKPSKYGPDGAVERFRRGFMPNSTLPFLASLTPRSIEGTPVTVHTVDEYVQTSLDYLDLLRKDDSAVTLLALAGVQSHQFQRGLDLAALALRGGVECCVMGGPHPLTCDTSMFHGRGLSFALGEAEAVWSTILADALRGELREVYAASPGSAPTLSLPPLVPPSRRDLRRYVYPLLGIYPARGCPFSCSFCSVIRIAGRRIRYQSIDTTMASLRAAKAAGVRAVMFTSDNFNKYPEAQALLKAMVEEQLRMPFFVQCDTQIGTQEPLVALLGAAGCFGVFLGVESFSRATLLAARKTQNRPESYQEIVRLCRRHGVATHFSNILGFPEDTAATIRQHLRSLQDVDPDVASFYILTPIPGTEQYDDFRREGRIRENNLDRFDGTCPTWEHPHLSPREWTRLLFDCYIRFHSAGHAVRSAWRGRYPMDALVTHAFFRYQARGGTHPMSGGVARVRRDDAGDYALLRRTRFGVDLAPLPDSLSPALLEPRVPA
jgi:hypothetical protein